jgi:hypothetical protein
MSKEKGEERNWLLNYVACRQMDGIGGHHVK